eukprot:581336-Rhodomonas_salina.1
MSGALLNSALGDRALLAHGPPLLVLAEQVRRAHVAGRARSFVLTDARAFARYTSVQEAAVLAPYACATQCRPTLDTPVCTQWASALALLAEPPRHAMLAGARPVASPALAQNFLVFTDHIRREHDLWILVGLNFCRRFRGLRPAKHRHCMLLESSGKWLGRLRGRDEAIPYESF